jgi:hypothetical protein
MVYGIDFMGCFLRERLITAISGLGGENGIFLLKHSMSNVYLNIPISIFLAY